MVWAVARQIIQGEEGIEVAWVSVHQEVDGPKLRKLARTLETSKAEALGIVNFLWFWAMNNADETGLVLEADREDVECALAGVAKIAPGKIVDALFSAGWLDDVSGHIYIHDWDTWQEQWYKLQKTRKYNAERMRKNRQEEKMKEAQRGVDSATKAEDSQSSEQTAPSSPGEKDADVKEKKRTPEKKKYAEFVKMTEDEYEKLVSRFGKSFTEACIETLDNYKGSKGVTYKSDYRTILNWVVERVREKRPGLDKASRESIQHDSENKPSNPFEEWSDE